MKARGVWGWKEFWGWWVQEGDAVWGGNAAGKVGYFLSVNTRNLLRRVSC